MTTNEQEAAGGHGPFDPEAPENWGPGWMACRKIREHARDDCIWEICTEEDLARAYGPNWLAVGTAVLRLAQMTREQAEQMFSDVDPMSFEEYEEYHRRAEIEAGPDYERTWDATRDMIEEATDSVWGQGGVFVYVHATFWTAVTAEYHGDRISDGLRAEMTAVWNGAFR